MKFSLLIALTFTCFSCTFKGVSTGSVEFVDDKVMTNLVNEIIILTSSESVEFVDIRTDQNEKTIKRTLRVDLIKPNVFPSTEIAKQIINKVRAKTKDPSLFTDFTVNEILKKEDSFPAKNINKTISFSLKEL
jgi:hypothetical protein